MKKPLMIIAAAVVSLQLPMGGAVMNTDISAAAKQAEKTLFDGDIDGAAKQFRPLIKAAEKAGNTAEAASVFDDYAWLMQTQGKMKDSLEYATRALTMRTQLLPPTTPELAQSYEHVGEIYDAQEMYQQAYDNYGKAHDIRIQGGPDQAIALGNVTEQMAQMAMKLGKSSDAIRLFNESLSTKATVNAQYQRYTNPPPFQTQFYKYSLGAPNCSREAVEGESLATIEANGIVVQATAAPASDFKGTTAYVRVINNGRDPVDFLPESPVFMEVQPNFRIAQPLNVDKIASDIERKGNRKANLIRFFQGNATTSGPSEFVTTSGSSRNNMNWGMYPNGQWGAYPVPNQRFNQTTMVTTQIPDWEARARAEAKAQAATEKANRQAALLRDNKLLATTIPPGQMVEGSILFDSRGVKAALLRIPIGNALFEFPILK